MTAIRSSPRERPHGRFPDGRIGELCLNNHKSNSTADVNARDAAIALSLALQSGVDVGRFAKRFVVNSHGRANGPLGAALDAVATEHGSWPCLSSR